MSYVDGFVVPVPRENVATYRRMSRRAGKVWMEHGALQYIEAVGDDMDVKFGVPFTKHFKLKAHETAFFSWILYRSRAHRDRVNAKVMKDPRMDKMVKKGEPMPFDVKRMVYGGFKTLVDAGQPG